MNKWENIEVDLKKRKSINDVVNRFQTNHKEEVIPSIGRIPSPKEGHLTGKDAIKEYRKQSGGGGIHFVRKI